MPTAISALTDAFRIAIYDTYDKAHPPETRPKEERDGSYLLNKHAILATSCWVYPIVSEFPEEKRAWIPYELRIDETGVIQHPIGPPNVSARIEERPAAYEYNPDHPRKVSFHQHVDSEGRPLMVRLFVSAFRLSSTAVKELCTAKYRTGRKNHIPALWSWNKEETSALRSANGYHLEEIRTYLTVGPGDGGFGVPERVWMAHSPFRVAKRRSDLYVRSWGKFARRFAAEHAKPEQWQRDHLLQTINDTIHTNPSVPSKYKAAIKHSHFEKLYREYDRTHAKRSRALNDNAKRLGVSLRHPFFQLLQFASMEEEGVPSDAEYSEALVEHVRTLAFVTRNLHNSPGGTAIILNWIADSRSSPPHFVNRLIFPQRELPTHIFKTARWASKSLFSVMSEIYDRIIIARNKTALEVAESLFHVGVFESIEAAREGLKKQTLSLDDIKKTLKLAPDIPTFTEAQLLKVQKADQVEKWLKSDLSDSVPWLESPTTVRRRAFLLIDIINVGLAYEAVGKAATVDDFHSALMGAMGATISVSVDITEQVLKRFAGEEWKTTSWGLRTWRCLRLATALASFAYAVSDFSSALKAFDRGEKKKGWALLSAAALEGGACVLCVAQAMAGGPVYSVAMAALGVAAAAAYTVALFSGIDPLEKFLQNCEFGVTPYADDDYHQPWVGAGIPTWKGDCRQQLRIFMRVLTRFALHWKRTTSTPNPLQVYVDCHRRTLDTRITVTYVAELEGEERITHKVARQGRELPNDKAPISFEPPLNYIDHGAKRVVVHAQLEVLSEGYDHSVYATVWSKLPGENRNIGRAGSVD